MTFELRPYQHEAEQEARIALAGGAKRVALYLPTGGGKTLTATSIIQKAVAKGRKVVFLANRKHLVGQTSDVCTATASVTASCRLRTPVALMLAYWLPPSTRCMFAVCRMMLACSSLTSATALPDRRNTGSCWLRTTTLRSSA